MKAAYGSLIYAPQGEPLLAGFEVSLLDQLPKLARAKVAASRRVVRVKTVQAHLTCHAVRMCRD